MTDFCHITPTPHLDNFAKGRKTHLVLAHLVESDPRYAQWYGDEKFENPESVTILDNGGFEMFKQGSPMYPSSKLVEMGTTVSADYIVMSDYPAEPGQKTIDKAVETSREIRDGGFGTFFVPQSNVGDIEDLIDGFAWAAESRHVDYIGVSILAIPNAYGVEQGNKLQRFLSRWHFLNILVDRGIVQKIQDNNKRVHMLGMIDGPNEISLVKDHLGYINTWDSSAAVWAGLNNIGFDNSPSGLVNGKYEPEVHFDTVCTDSTLIDLAKTNCDYIDNLINMETDFAR